MASRSDDAEPLHHTSRSDPCQKCQFTTCSALHEYSASSCPHNICTECGQLEDLDAQIAQVQDQLINLTIKRYELKNRINRRHDCLTSQLPLETTSRIFYFVADESLSTLVTLGVVCKRWREITLGIPQLWTNLTVTESNVKDPSLPNLIAQWGSRSYGLPLSLTLHDYTMWVPYGVLQSYRTVVLLLRAHAHRWKDLTIRLYELSPLFNTLLSGLEDQLIVDSLTISFLKPELVKITMKHPFSPKRLDIQLVPLSAIPIEYKRLTHLAVAGISADALIHIFDHAHNLLHCSIADIQQSTNQYPIPISPITNTSVKRLDLTSRVALNADVFSSSLTLPSLENLHYRLASDNIEAEIAAMIKLKAFLDRSRPPLCDFSVRHVDWGEHPTINCDWHRILPSITTLSLHVWIEEKGKRMQAYLKNLAVNADPTDRALPSLRELKFDSKQMCVDSWDALVGLFPDPEGSHDPSHEAPRPLKSVTIRTEMSWDVSKEIIPKATYTRLRAIQDSGVVLHVFDVNRTDMLGSDINLTFDETEDVSND